MDEKKKIYGDFLKKNGVDPANPDDYRIISECGKVKLYRLIDILEL